MVLREVGDKPSIANPRDHLEIGEALGAIDVERGAKVSGSRFYYLTGVGALLQLGLLQLAMQQAVEAGLTPVIPPVLVKPESMEGTGFLGAHASEIYRLEADDLFLVGTSEVPLAAYHSGEILNLDEPKRYVGWSSCFRREAGSYGKDVRGILRVHQFDKVEMFVYSRPEDAHDEHLRLLAWEEEMLAKVEIPYRVIDVAAGDLGLQRGPQVRLRGVGAVAGALPRGHVDVQLHHVPGAAAQHPLPGRRRPQPAGGDPERDTRDDPVAHPDPGEPPAAGRVGARTEGSSAVPGRPRRPHSLTLGTTSGKSWPQPPPEATTSPKLCRSWVSSVRTEFFRDAGGGPACEVRLLPRTPGRRACKTRPGLPKLIATDLDGTLVRSDDTVSAYTHEVLARVRAAGIRIVGATGRGPRLTELVRSDIPSADFLVMGGGGRVVDMTDPDTPLVLRDERLTGRCARRPARQVGGRGRHAVDPGRGR